MGCQAEIEQQSLTPATINHPETAARVQAIARRLFSEVDLDTNYITMGSEDFAYVQEKVPGCFILIGSSNSEKGLDAGHHHPRFDIDEAALPRGVALLAATITDYLKS
jgi:amidohydrolase